MRVKIGNKIYDAKDEPIMIILEGNDKNNIANMLPEATMYCSFPDKGYTSQDIEDFMNTCTVCEYEKLQDNRYILTYKCNSCKLDSIKNK